MHNLLFVKEEVLCTSHGALSSDKKQLDHEIRRLQKDLEMWKVCWMCIHVNSDMTVIRILFHTLSDFVKMPKIFMGMYYVSLFSRIWHRLILSILLVAVMHHLVC